MSAVPRRAMPSNAHSRTPRRSLSEDQLKVAIRAGGYQGGDDVAGQSDAIRPSQD